VLAGVTPEFTGKENGEYLLDLPAGYDANDKAFIAQGEKNFGIYCAPCHGKAADGVSPIARRYPVPPPSFKQKRLYAMPLGQIYAAITHGKNVPNMPAYATQIPDVKARWGVVAYLRKTMMKEDPKTVVAFKVDPTINDVKVAEGTDPAVAAGAALYTAKTCNACHSIDGSRVVGPTFAGIYGRKVKGSGGERVTDDAYIRESIMEPNKFVVEGYAPAMPQLNLTEEEITQVIAWMKTLEKK
jgi:mono/diheme cytochrome c family protein